MDVEYRKNFNSRNFLEKRAFLFDNLSEQFRDILGDFVKELETFADIGEYRSYTTPRHPRLLRAGCISSTEPRTRKTVLPDEQVRHPDRRNLAIERDSHDHPDPIRAHGPPNGLQLLRRPRPLVRVSRLQHGRERVQHLPRTSTLYLPFPTNETAAERSRGDRRL